EMRDLMSMERPPSGFWDLKLSEGGLVDIEFAAQAVQIANAAPDGPLRTNTGDALEALEAAGLIEPDAARALTIAWTLQQDLGQVLKVALPDEADPTGEPARFKAILANAGGERTFPALEKALAQRRKAAHAEYLTTVRAIDRAGNAGD
ncbi:MAG: glutamine-synthetase adenylyltransferase, partial [Pseudomonadota bacterium]|nr:glutamine-synthetase adenylyltransferase [Pseudomonadota bacterium]